jgi:hypothetical protein
MSLSDVKYSYTLGDAVVQVVTTPMNIGELIHTVGRAVRSIISTKVTIFCVKHWQKISNNNIIVLKLPSNHYTKITFVRACMHTCMYEQEVTGNHSS